MSTPDKVNTNKNELNRSEFTIYSTYEKTPSLVLLESGQNPGELLRTARERAGLSLADVSIQTKINEKQLLSIESGDVSRLPPKTFAKAFVKSYCKVLKIDYAPVLLAYGFEDVCADDRPNRLGAADGKGEPFEPKMPSSSRRLSSLNFDRKQGKKPIGYIIAFAAAVLMAVFYLPVFLADQSFGVFNFALWDKKSPQSSSNGGVESQVANQEPAFASPTEVQRNTDAGTVSETLALPLENQEPGSNAGSSGVSVFPAIEAEKQKVAQVLATPLAPVPDSKAESTISANALTLPVASAASVNNVLAAPPLIKPKAVSAAESSLKFSFADQSWVTVRDVNDQVLLSQLNEGGSSVQVRGVPPFKLIVGNAQNVNLVHNGKPINLTGSIRGEVARLTVE